MKVYVNNIELRIFKGATAGDAVNLYYKWMHEPQPEQRPVIFDRFGNQIETDGELSSNNQLFINPEITTTYE